jgi:DNA excision repair protein ERCC-4
MMTLRISVRCNSSKDLPDPRTNDLHPAEIEEIDESQIIFEDNADDYFELYDNEDIVVILPYDGDMDDRVLEEMKPRFVVMYEPNPSFIRRIEVSHALASLI